MGETAAGGLTAADFYEEEEYDYNNEIPDIQRLTKKNNVLTLWGNQNTMNLNALVLENVRESYYYKNHLVEIDNFQTLVDDVFYKVKHLEPWEKGTRKVQGMTGMCGGVRGVGAGGVVSSAFCILYRLFNIKITRKQLISMINSRVSPYIRGLGFMYIRYTQPPADLWYWLEPYMDDEDEIDPRSGGGDPMTFGQMVRLMLNKLDWYGTLFPRIPVPIQKDIDEKFNERKRETLLLHAAQQPNFDREHYGSRERERSGSRGLSDRDRDSRKRAADKSDRVEQPEVKKPTRCKHHLRHHHCRKHRKQCPHKAKADRKVVDEANAAEAPVNASKTGESNSTGNVKEPADPTVGKSPIEGTATDNGAVNDAEKSGVDDSMSS